MWLWWLLIKESVMYHIHTERHMTWLPLLMGTPGTDQLSWQVLLSSIVTATMTGGYNNITTLSSWVYYYYYQLDCSCNPFTRVVDSVLFTAGPSLLLPYAVVSGTRNAAGSMFCGDREKIWQTIQGTQITEIKVGKLLPYIRPVIVINADSIVCIHGNKK